MFVRAGSILPLGPEMQYVGEKKWNELEMRVYPGADGSFVLYEDEGDGYDYEKGAYTTITFRWNDKQRQLTIGQREGSFAKVLIRRHFTVVMPDGTSQTVDYDGREQTLSF
jgi:alpha-D-xyloside xylohydrolase